MEYATVKPAQIIGDEQPDSDAIEAMRSQISPEGRWAAFQNHDLGSREVGHVMFMAVGPNNTTKRIDHPSWGGSNWRYIFVGFVNLETGKIEA